jgi:hypothetical protein
MDKGSITSGGEKKCPLWHCCQRGKIHNKTQLKEFLLFFINAKGEECWTWPYVVIDVNKV